VTHRGPFQPLLFCDSVILSVRASETAPRRQKTKPGPADAGPSPCKGRVSLYFFGYGTNPFNQPKRQVKSRALKNGTLVKFNPGDRALHLVFCCL